MSNKELAVVSQEELDALAYEMGANTEDLNGGGGTFLPVFKVWSLDDDDEDENAPRRKGKLYITGQEPLVFAKPGTVRFRPITHTFQWTQYDEDAKAVTNKTRLVYNFKEEARDEKGTVKCGKPASKDLRDNKELKEKYADITTYRRLQGYVSYTGVDETGNEVEVKDVLVAINSKGASFSSFDEDFLKKMPPKTSLWDYEAAITLDRERNGTVTYWVMRYAGDFATKLPVTVGVFNTLRDLKEKIEATNKAIDKKYWEAVNNRNGDADAIDALKTVSAGRPKKGQGQTLDSDMNDDIPFD